MFDIYAMLSGPRQHLNKKFRYVGAPWAIMAQKYVRGKYLCIKQMSELKNICVSKKFPCEERNIFCEKFIISPTILCGLFYSYIYAGHIIVSRSNFAKIVIEIK